MYVVGKFLDVYPVEKVTETFSKRLFAIDTEESFNNILVFELQNARLELCNGLEKGQLVAVNFNLACRKSEAGKWFPTIAAWAVKPYVAQTADDFTAPPAATTSHMTSPEPVAATDDLPF